MSDPMAQYVEAAEVECEGLDRERLIRRVAALMRRLDSETAQCHVWRQAYSKLLRDSSTGEERPNGTD